LNYRRSRKLEEKMQRIKKIISDIKNQDTREKLQEVIDEIALLSDQRESDARTIRDITASNELLNDQLNELREDLQSVNSVIIDHIEQIDESRATMIAVSSWAIFFLAVSSAVYAIVNSL